MQNNIEVKEKILNYLVCVNSEEYSEAALQFACRLAKQNNGKIIILHVIEPVDYQSIGSIAEKMRREKIDEAEKLLIKLADKTATWFDRRPALLVKEGLIEEQIISLVEKDLSINMLIVGTAQETNIKSKILPPLVTNLGNKLQIPMLIVPGGLTEYQIKLLTLG